MGGTIMYHTINDVLSLVNVMHTKAKEVEKRQSITKEDNNEAEIDILMSDIGYMANLLAEELKSQVESRKWSRIKSLGET
tara:strand:- start:107 stop:346 length:240 start_codon:yes stop_codon:yes gene_type:complete